jgi:hypothetical protein
VALPIPADAPVMKQISPLKWPTGSSARTAGRGLRRGAEARAADVAPAFDLRPISFADFLIYDGAMRRLILSLLALVAVAGCRGNNTSERPLPLAPGHLPEVPSGAASVSPGASGEVGVRWTAPADWKPQPPESAMRQAQYAIPAASGDPPGAEMVVYYFGPGQGGSVEDNVARWKGQLLAPDGSAAPARVAKTTVHGLSVTTIESEGTYSAAMMPGASEPKPGWAMWGAIVEGPQGNVFFKATGPQKSIAAAHSDFQKLLQSFAPQGERT